MALEGAVPWKSSTPVDLRMEFITRLHKGERITDLCREYGISRKTGHKLKNRYEEFGVVGLEDQSRAPKTTPHRTSPELVKLVLAERKRHPTWGPRKLKASLEERVGRALPSASTIGEVLLKAGVVERRKTRGWGAARNASVLTTPAAPNELWCADYKRQFRLGDRSYCYPLTVTDQFSRYVLSCEGMAAISDEEARATFKELFKERGLPSTIRADNGVPFASRGLAGLTALSAYWMRLGIRLERIRPAHPEENGQHERMHRTLKRETTRPPRQNLLQQQELFDAFMAEFNEERPHEAIGMKRPAQLYRPSKRPLPEVLPEPEYAMHDDVLTVNRIGHLSVPGRGKVYLSLALVGHPVGIREEDDGRWLVSFMDLDLGHVESNRQFTPMAFTPPKAS